MLANTALWNDAAPFRRRFERSAMALVAVHEALSRNPGLAPGGEEHHALYRVMRDAPAEAFTRVWSDPSCHFWAVAAYRLLGACLGAEPPSADVASLCRLLEVATPRHALAVHLGHFKRLALGAAVAADAPVSFDPPLYGTDWLAIPGSRWVVAGQGELEVRGYAAGALQVAQGGAPAHIPLSADDTAGPEVGVRVVQCPVARAGRYELALNPPSFLFPGVEIGAPLRGLGFELQRGLAPLVSDALHKIARHQPGTLAQMEEVVRVVALKPRSLGDYTNVSQSDLPGAFVCSAVRDPYVLADSMIHEMHHNRLFYLQEETPLFAEGGDGVADAGTLYSPWRDDPRPAQGILHGLYVYLPVFWFWRDVLRAAEGPRAPRGYALDQVARIPLQSQCALEQLRRHARFTAEGEAMLAALAREVDDAARAAAGFAAPEETPAISADDDGVFPAETDPQTGREISVRESLERHAARFAGTSA
jgi:HEXXH motif-containing protein